MLLRNFFITSIYCLSIIKVHSSIIWLLNRWFVFWRLQSLRILRYSIMHYITTYVLYYTLEWYLGTPWYTTLIPRFSIIHWNDNTELARCFYLWTVLLWLLNRTNTVCTLIHISRWNVFWEVRILIMKKITSTLTNYKEYIITNKD